MDVIKKILLIFGKAKFTKLLFLIILLTIGVVLETISILMVFPLMRLVNNSQYIESQPILSYLYEALNFTSRQNFLIAACLTLIILLTFINFYRIWVNHFKFTFISREQSFLSSKLLEYYMNQPYTYWLNKNKSEIIKNINSDVNVIYNKILTKLLSLCTDVLLVVLITSILLIVNYTLTFIILLIGATIGSIYLLFHLKTSKIFKSQQALRSEMVSSLKQVVLAGPEIKGMGKESYFTERFLSQIDSLTRNVKTYNVLILIPPMLTQNLRMFGIITVVLIGLLSDTDFSSLLPYLVLFGMAFLRIMPLFNRILKSYFDIRLFKLSLDVIYSEILTNNIFNSVPERNNNDSSRYKESKTLPVSLDNVNYQYTGPGPKAHTLKNINVTIPAGSTVSITGPTGSGKTTIGEIIAGLIKPQSGKVLFDNNDLSENSQIWKSMVSYISKTPYIFDATIRDNITFGRNDDVNDAKVWELLKIVNLYEYVGGLPRQLDTIIGGNKRNSIPTDEELIDDEFDATSLRVQQTAQVDLTANQIKQVAIARALYDNSGIIIMDETTSAFEEDLERKIIESLSSKTVIIISKNLRAIRYCDLVYEIVDGELSLKEGLSAHSN